MSSNYEKWVESFIHGEDDVQDMDPQSIWEAGYNHALCDSYLTMREGEKKNA